MSTTPPTTASTKPHDASPSAEVIRGDALAVLPTLAAGSIDCVITDPPYNSGGRTTGERASQSARGKYVSGYAKHTLANFAGDNRDQRSYGYWLALVLAECLRTARPGASCLVFSDFRQLPTTSDALQAAGWTWRGILPWHKPNTRPQPNGFRRAYEYVLWGSNGPLLRHDPTIYLPGWFSHSQPSGPRRQHITQKPVEVITELVRVCPPGGRVLDPFTGSGSTGVAALTEGRSFLGIEVTEHYAAIARQRLSQTLTECRSREAA